MAGIFINICLTEFDVWQKLCYVAQDFVEEHYNENCEASCEVGTDGTFTLRSERFRAPEILFQPRLGNL